MVVEIVGLSFAASGKGVLGRGGLDVVAGSSFSLSLCSGRGVMPWDVDAK